MGRLRGELTIKRGLKRRARKRKLLIDREMKAVLERLIKESDCDYRLRVHQPAGSGPAARTLGARRADGTAAQKDQDTRGRRLACAAAHVSDRGWGVHGSVHVAVRGGTR